jgi:23S rRNA (pseudouridine1915-N3)-methyltransferase
MKIKIICISDSDKHFDSAIWEYKKRFMNKLEIINIKPCKNWTVKKIIDVETDNILKYLKKIKSYKILLSINSNQIDTLEFKNKLTNIYNLCFVIWWPYWLNESKLEKNIDYKMSLSKFTFPHGLAKLVLLEQLYRVNTIINNKKYHY